MSNKKNVQKIVLGGVVVKDNKVLILQRHKNETVYPNIWELPSGKKELLEQSENSLLREVKEETGLDIEIIMPFSVFDYQIENPKGIYDTTQVNFLARPLKSSGEVELSVEHQAFAWINENEIDEYNLTEKTKDVIKKAFKLLLRIY